VTGTAAGRPALSVVVMGYRDHATITAAVRSVLDQEAAEPFEVVVVTSGDDRSAPAVRSAFPEVAVVASPHRLLPGGARNVGVAASHGDIVAFLAADCLAEPGWVQARQSAHRAGHPVVAGAMTSAPPHHPSAVASHLALYCQRLAGRPAGPVDPGDPAAHGLSYERAVVDRLGPFDPDLRVGEDTEAARRLAGLGVPVWFEPRVRTAHRGPRTTRALWADHHRRGRMAARVDGTGARPVSLARTAVALPAATVLVSTTTVAAAWRNGRGERGRLTLTLPWVVAAVAASQTGRYRERRRPGR
jgi:GT2 family glycosyltransferase